MKKGFSIAMVYIGLVIGAGFASGREIMTYFNLPSSTRVHGVALATALLILVGYLILRKCYRFGIAHTHDYYAVVAGNFAPWIERFLLLYLFCGFITMHAGCGALLSEALMLPSICGVLLLAFLCFLVLTFDLKGIVSLNLILVPLMLLGMALLCITTIFKSSAVFSLPSAGQMVSFSALCYVSYNTLSAPSVLVPLQKGISYQGLLFASLFSGLVLGGFIFLIWFCQALSLDALKDSPLPLLHLAALLGKQERRLYSLVLFMAMLTTAVGQGFGLLAQRPSRSRGRRAKESALLCLLALPFALIDFSSLVTYLYGFFGIAGLLWMGWLFVDYYWKKPL